MQANYITMRRVLIDLLGDLEILSGDVMGPSGVSKQDIIGTAKTNAAVLVAQLERAYKGQSEPFLVFPSPSDCMENR